MFDVISIVIGVVGAVLGIAGVFLLAGTVILLAALARNLPNGVRAVISAVAASLVAVTVFKHLASEYADVMTFRILLGLSVQLGICGIYFISESGSAIDRAKILLSSFFSRTTRVTMESFSSAPSDNSKKLSSPSFRLKALSVMLQ